jgi:hypothetical protein
MAKPTDNSEIGKKSVAAVKAQIADHPRNNKAFFRKQAASPKFRKTKPPQMGISVVLENDRLKT